MKAYILALVFICQSILVSAQTLEFRQASPNTDSMQTQKHIEAHIANIVFRSVDGGQTWQDISEGLPEIFQEALLRDDVFADGSGLHFRAGNMGIYHSIPNSTAPFWKKEAILQWQGSTSPGNKGRFAYSYECQFFQEIDRTSLQLPAFMNYPSYSVRSIFKTAKGNIFIGSERGLDKSTNNGKTWKQVITGGGVLKLVESNGVLLATSQDGIIRSTDYGENWDYVLYEGGVGITVERIKDGFAAIVASRQSISRTVHTSYDEGKTWQPIDAGLPASLDIASIIQVGENFFCGHPDGIYQSTDKGKTWKLILPSVNGRVFNLFVSGNTIYAIPLSSGC